MTSKDNKKVKREEGEEATGLHQDNGCRRTRLRFLPPPAPAFERPLLNKFVTSFFGDSSSLIDEQRQSHCSFPHIPVRPLYQPPVRTLDMYTQKEILRHERCRAYALYGTKTPNMIAAEKKKAAKKITAGTTGATMTTKKTAPIAVREDDPGNNNDRNTDVISLESRCNDDGCHPLLLDVDSVLATLA